MLKAGKSEKVENPKTEESIYVQKYDVNPPVKADSSQLSEKQDITKNTVNDHKVNELMFSKQQHQNNSEDNIFEHNSAGLKNLNSMLLKAVIENKVDNINLLLSEGAKPVPDFDFYEIGTSPMMIAWIAKNQEAFDILLNKFWSMKIDEDSLSKFNNFLITIETDHFYQYLKEHAQTFSSIREAILRFCGKLQEDNLAEIELALQGVNDDVDIL